MERVARQWLVLVLSVSSALSVTGCATFASEPDAPDAAALDAGKGMTAPTIQSCTSTTETLDHLPASQPGFSRSPADTVKALVGNWRSNEGDRMELSATGSAEFVDLTEVEGSPAALSTAPRCADRFDVGIEVKLAPATEALPAGDAFATLSLTSWTSPMFSISVSVADTRRVSCFFHDDRWTVSVSTPPVRSGTGLGGPAIAPTTRTFDRE
jgi:hypothetical protein